MSTPVKVPSAPAALALAAHGITGRTAATWYPQLLRMPRLMVPIELAVLMVRDPNRKWAKTAMATPKSGPAKKAPVKGKPAKTPPPTPADSLMPKLFTEIDPPRPRGAYMQWYLPRAFTSGVPDPKTGLLNFPPIPDRWLVLRISPGHTALRRSVRGWVLEAGGEPAQWFDVRTWRESGKKPDVQNPINALGHGDLAWAGYFDNVNGRLGFADNTIDKDKIVGPISYLVCGWFSDPSMDPLGAQTIHSRAAFDAKMKDLGWTFDESDLPGARQRSADYVRAAKAAGLSSPLPDSFAATLGLVEEDQLAAGLPWWPQGCLLHGATVGIDWPGSASAAEAGGPPAPSSISVVVGNTLAEAMGTIVATANGVPAQAQMVEALQIGVVKELGQPDGRARFDVKMHAESFASVSGGDPISEPVQIAPSGPPQAPPANPAAPGPGIFARHADVTSVGAGTARTLPLGSAQTAEVPQVPGVRTGRGATPTVLAENFPIQGHLNEVLSTIGAGAKLPEADSGGLFAAERSRPRYYSPEDPVLLIQGGRRAFAHDSTVKTEDGLIVCRAVPVSELSWQMPKTPVRYAVRGRDILENGVENGSVPPECELLLHETAVLDPGSASAMAATADPTRSSTSPQPGASFDRPTAERNIVVEQTVWYALRKTGVDYGPLLAHSGIAGVLPAPFAMSPQGRPWTPLQLQWSGEFLPSPRGEEDWTLEEIDFVLNKDAQVPAPGTGIPVSGRTTLTGGASQALAAAVANAIQQAASISGTDPVPAGNHEAFFSDQAKNLVEKYSSYVLARKGQSASPFSAPGLTDIATALSQMDVLSCGLNGLITQLRGGLAGDGQSTRSDGKTPDPFFAFRAGFLRIRRLRLVDGFGQFLDLCGSDATHDAQRLLISPPLTVDGHSQVAGLPPRFTAPTRIWFRYMSAENPGVEADYQSSPVCGFLMPNHLEGSLEFFNPDGSGAGALLPGGDGTVSWQAAPGLGTAAGEDPGSTLTDPHAAQLARSLIGWGLADTKRTREPSLSALLRTIDSTLWSIDPFGHQGDEHISLLLGHPICLMRALLRLDVDDTIETADNTVIKVPVRLGNLTQWVDGLLGYFVNDDYSVLHVGDSASPDMARQVGPHKGFLQQIHLVPPYYATFANDLAAGKTPTSPVKHPYLDKSGIVWIRPNQTIHLTLLVEPLTSVHATSGLAPRKEIGMRREWVNAGLAAIAPTFRFGPVLVDPHHIRMPLPVDLNGTWVWDYRAAAAQWAENPATNATEDALLGQDPPTPIEGWLKLEPPKPKGSGQ